MGEVGGISVPQRAIVAMVGPRSTVSAEQRKEIEAESLRDFGCLPFAWRPNRWIAPGTVVLVDMAQVLGWSAPTGERTE